MAACRQTSPCSSARIAAGRMGPRPASPSCTKAAGHGSESAWRRCRRDRRCNHGALVHEAFVKLLAATRPVAFENRRHFFGGRPR